jgi:hypothetical protein
LQVLVRCPDYSFEEGVDQDALSAVQKEIYCGIYRDRVPGLEGGSE